MAPCWFQARIPPGEGRAESPERFDLRSAGTGCVCGLCRIPQRQRACHSARSLDHTLMGHAQERSGLDLADQVVRQGRRLVPYKNTATAPLEGAAAVLMTSGEVVGNAKRRRGVVTLHPPSRAASVGTTTPALGGRRAPFMGHAFPLSGRYSEALTRSEVALRLEQHRAPFCSRGTPAGLRACAGYDFFAPESTTTPRRSVPSLRGSSRRSSAPR